MKCRATKETATDGRPSLRFAPDDKAALGEFLARCKDGQNLSVEVKRPVRRRSDAAMGYYWHCLGLMAEDTGNGVEDIHEHLRALYLSDHAEPVPHVRSTTGLSVADMSRYIDDCQRWSAEALGFVWPEPDRCEDPRQERE